MPQSRPRHRRRPSPGHTRAPFGRSDHSDAKPRCVALPAPPPAGRRQSPPRRTRCPRSPSAYRHPTAHAITSHCARRCPLLWFLTFDKPETLSDNDVRPLRSATRPRKCHKSPISRSFVPKSVPKRSLIFCRPGGSAFLVVPNRQQSVSWPATDHDIERLVVPDPDSARTGQTRLLRLRSHFDHLTPSK